MTKGPGNKITPLRVMTLVKESITEKSIRSLSKITGLGQAALSRYANGKGEPNTATLEKLASCFYVTVPWLRGGAVGPTELLLEGLKISGVTPNQFEEKMFLYMLGFENNWLALIRGEFTQYMINLACEEFSINENRVRPGNNIIDPETEDINPCTHEHILFRIRNEADLRKKVVDLLKTKP